MKFNCLDHVVKAKQKAANLREWHNWFAWRPVRVGKNDCRWLEMLERRYPSAFTGILYPEKVYKDSPEYRAKEKK